VKLLSEQELHYYTNVTWCGRVKSHYIFIQQISVVVKTNSWSLILHPSENNNIIKSNFSNVIKTENEGENVFIVRQGRVLVWYILLGITQSIILFQISVAC
jgi:hypothetical protein